MDFNPNNEYSPLVKTYILYARDRDGQQIQSRLLKEWKKDTTRLDILQEVAKAHYFKEEYDSAFYYYEKSPALGKAWTGHVWPGRCQNCPHFKKKGLDALAASISMPTEATARGINRLQKFKYGCHARYEGDYDKAIEQMKIFATQDNYQFGSLFPGIGPYPDPLKGHPEFAPTVQKIKDRFWEEHEKLEKSLEDKGLL